MIRRRAYFTILAGAFGHQYGAGGIWDTLDKPEECSGSYLDALEYEGATTCATSAPSSAPSATIFSSCGRIRT